MLLELLVEPVVTPAVTICCWVPPGGVHMAIEDAMLPYGPQDVSS